MLSMVLKLLVAVARRGEAWINGVEVLAPAEVILRLELLRRCSVKLRGGEGSERGGEQLCCGGGGGEVALFIGERGADGVYFTRSLGNPKRKV
jgi:hypothetical protein